MRTLQYFLKNFKFVLPIKSWKKHPKKLHTYGSWEVFFLCSPDCPKEPRTSFPFYKFFYPTISCRISDTKVFYSLLTSIDPECGIKLKNKFFKYLAFMTLTTFDKYFNISRWLESLNWTFLCSYYHFQFSYDFCVDHVIIEV